MISHVKFVGIPTADQDRALAFYTEQLGFGLVTDQPFDGAQRWIELRIGSSETRVVLFTPEGPADRIGSFFHGALGCDDVAKTYEELTARGVEFTSPPTREAPTPRSSTGPSGSTAMGSPSSASRRARSRAAWRRSRPLKR